MSKRKKFRDRFKAETAPRVVKFKPGEDPMDRHRRRLETNSELFLDDAKKWAEENGVRFSVTNGTHHWSFYRDQFIVEWRPSSAKCVINKRWEKGIHVHEWPQLKVILAANFPSRDGWFSKLLRESEQCPKN